MAPSDAGLTSNLQLMNVRSRNGCHKCWFLDNLVTLEVHDWHCWCAVAQEAAQQYAIAQMVVVLAFRCHSLFESMHNLDKWLPTTHWQ
jgi:hypothetical protein